MNINSIPSGKWLSRAAALAVALLIGSALVSTDAEARRLGGGKSFGRQSQSVTRQPVSPPTRDTQPPAVQPQPTQPPPMQPARNRWLGPVAGLAAGLGLAALFSHFGMGGALAEGLGSMLLIGLLVLAAFFVWRMLRGARTGPPPERRLEPAYSTGDNSYRAPVSGYAPPSGGAQPGSVAAMSAQPEQQASGPWGVPPDFDVPGFLRNAKVYFIRLQAAWDAKNLDDIREFTTPEVFAEVKMQIQEEGAAVNRTEVATLEGQLLGIETTATDYLASVRFTGSIRENDGAPQPFEEVWNLSKPIDGRSGWVLAGIQQIH